MRSARGRRDLDGRRATDAWRSAGRARPRRADPDRRRRPVAVRRPGQVLADIIDSAAVPIVRLTEVFRQAAKVGSSPTLIASIRAACRTGPGILKATFTSYLAGMPKTRRSKIIEIVKDRIRRASASTRSATSRSVPDEPWWPGGQVAEPRAADWSSTRLATPPSNASAGHSAPATR